MDASGESPIDIHSCSVSQAFDFTCSVMVTPNPFVPLVPISHYHGTLHYSTGWLLTGQLSAAPNCVSMAASPTGHWGSASAATHNYATHLRCRNGVFSFCWSFATN